MNAAVRSSRSAYWAIGLLVLVTVAARLPGIHRPLLGAFATKNAVYGMIARNWALGRAPLARPTLDCLAGGQRAWHLVEVPVAAYVAGALWRVAGGSLDVWGRLVSIGASAAAVALLFLLVRRWHGEAAAWAAALVFSLAPVSVIYGQAFMLEASLVALTLGVIYCLENWHAGGRWPWLAGTACLFALVVLTKVYMLVLLLPLAMWGRGTEQSPSQRRRLVAFVALVAAALPAATWYVDAWRTGAPDSPDAGRLFYSVYASTAAHAWPHPLLFQAGFYHQALADLATCALSPLGFLLALLGLTDRDWRKSAWWLAGMGLLLLALPRKFHEMNYYYLVVLPPLCVLAGLGWRQLQERLRPGRLAVAALLIVGVLGALRYAVRPAFVTPSEDRGVVAAARAMRELTEAGEPVVTMHGSTIDLLYYCDRPGWAVPPDLPDLAARLREFRRHGARRLVIAGVGVLDPSQPNLALLDALPVIRQGDDFRVCQIPDDQQMARIANRRVGQADPDPEIK